MNKQTSYTYKPPEDPMINMEIFFLLIGSIAVAWLLVNIIF